MTDIPTTIKSKKLVEKKRETIVYAAIKLFAEKGFHKTTIRDLSVATALSQGSIYDYVQNKEDILSLIHNFISDIASKTLHQSIENIENPIEKLRRLIRAEIGTIDRNIDSTLLIYRETQNLSKDRLKEILQIERARVEIFETVIHECIEAGLFYDGNVRLISNFIKSMIDTWALKRWDLRGHANQIEVEQTILELIFNGLCYQDGLDSKTYVATTDLRGKTALVLNGGTVLGVAVQAFLASHGVRVAAYVDGATTVGQEHQRVLRQNTIPIELYDSNNYGPMQVELLQKIKKDLGRIDIFIHDIGIGNLNLFGNNDADSEAGRRLNENLACAEELAQDYLQTESVRRHGRIIYMAPWAWDGLANRLRYATVKGSTISLTRAMAGMMAKSGITVNCIVPGYIRGTRPSLVEKECGPDIMRRIPMGCLGDISDITNALGYLVSDAAKFITGQILNCSGDKD